MEYLTNLDNDDDVDDDNDDFDSNHMDDNCDGIFCLKRKQALNNMVEHYFVGVVVLDQLEWINYTTTIIKEQEEKRLNRESNYINKQVT